MFCFMNSIAIFFHAQIFMTEFYFVCNYFHPKVFFCVLFSRCVCVCVMSTLCDNNIKIKGNPCLFIASIFTVASIFVSV